MSHYFKNDPNLKSEESVYEVDLFDHKFKFITDKGVFSKDHLDTGTYALISYVDIPDKAMTLLDVGSGIGVIGIIFKKIYNHLNITQIDVNQRGCST